MTDREEAEVWRELLRSRGWDRVVKMLTAEREAAMQRLLDPRVAPEQLLRISAELRILAQVLNFPKANLASLVGQHEEEARE